MRAGRWSYAFLAAVLVLVYLPLLSVVMFSFSTNGVPTLPLDGVTTHWYKVVFSDADLLAALWVTVRVGLITVFCVLLLATAAAFGLRGRAFRGRGAYEALLGMPFLLPEVITGVALLTLFNVISMDLSMATIIAGHVLFCLGVAFRVVAARVESLPRSLDDASHDLGRGDLATFWFVLLPAIRSSLMTAGLLTFALSFDQTVITIFVSGDNNTLPTLLWAKLRLDTTPEVNAFAALLLAASLVFAVVLMVRSGKELFRR